MEETRYFLGEGRRPEGITLPSDRVGVLSVAERVPIRRPDRFRRFRRPHGAVREAE